VCASAPDGSAASAVVHRITRNGRYLGDADANEQQGSEQWSGIMEGCVALGASISEHDAPDFYLNSETLRIRRVTAIAGKPGGILEEPEVIRAQTS